MLKQRSIFILLLLAAIVQPSGGQELQWLQYRWARQAREIVGDMSSQYLKTSNNKPKGVELPGFKGKKPLFHKWSSPMDKNGFRWIALDNTRKHGPHNRLFIDSDGDGKLSDETAIAAYQTEQDRTYFGPVKVIFEGEDGPVVYHLNFEFYSRENHQRLYVYSGGWYEGTVTVAGEKKHCVLIDQNANGVFDDKSINFHQSDRIRVGKKKDSDSKFVGNYIEIDDKLYQLEIARDGAYIKLSRAKDVTFGNIKLSETIREFAAGGENGLFLVDLEKGIGQLPIGKYRIHHWLIERKDKKDNIWKLKGQWFRDKGLFDVAKFDQTKLAIGEPVISILEFERKKNEYSLSHKLEGKLGERIELTCNGDRARAPKLHIKSQDGVYDRTFALEYG
ncbi:MAG: hypothetical protein ACYSSI_00970 [Planctomycetota bacterium]|jgi:hypothetical protein